MAAPRSTRSKIIGAPAAGFVIVAFCVILLCHNPLVFWNDDYELSILPVFADVARSWNEGHFPLLSPYSWVCSNLAGEFEYGTFSIFVNAAVVLIWKFPLTFPQQATVLSITHLVVLAIGAFLLAHDRLLDPEIIDSALVQPSPAGRGGRQSRRVREPYVISLSIFVALAATLSGWIICWGATDWFGALGAFAWLPWAWWSLEHALWSAQTSLRPPPDGLAVASFQSGDMSPHSKVQLRQRMIGALWPAPFVYLLVTGGFPYTVVMLLLLIGWLSIKSLVQTRRLLSIAPMLFGVALGFGLSAPAWLAILDYVHGSARELQESSAHWQWLVPWRALPGFILPWWTVKWADFYTHYIPHTATEMACGLVAPAVLIAGLIWHGRLIVRRIKWDLFLLLLVLLLSMLPTAGLFRWSFRWLPFLHLVLAICAAEVLLDWPGSAIPAVTGFALVGLTAIAMSFWHVTGPYAFPLTWIFLGLAVLWMLAEFFPRDSKLREWTPALITFAAFLATYLCLPTNGGVPRFNLSQQLLEPAPLDPQRLYLSIYPAPEFNFRVENKSGPIGQIVRPGSTSMWAGLRFINGYSPIRPAGVAREFCSYIHGEIDLNLAANLLREQAGPEGKLARIGVDGIVIAREFEENPQPASEWDLVFSNDEGRVFHRRGSRFERVRSVSSLDSKTGERFSLAMVSRINDSRNEVAADVEVPEGGNPAVLVFSRPYFRGYQASINGKKLPVESADGLIPIVRVPPGTSGRLELEYHPTWLVLGTIVACVCAAIFAIGLFARQRL